MTPKNDGQTGKPEEVDEDYFGKSDAPVNHEGPAYDLETGTDPHAEAMAVSLNRATHAGEDCVEVYAHSEANPKKSAGNTQQTVLLARVTDRELTTFPLVSASYRPAFLTPKYDELTTITILADEHDPWWFPESIPEFDALLDSLPVGFSRHAKYGLGFKWEYRLIPDAILETRGISELVIEPGTGAVVQRPKFRLGVERFSKIRRAIDLITRRSQVRSLRDRRLLAYNELLHAADPAQFERRFAKVKPGEIYELVHLGGRAHDRTTNDILAAATVIRDDAEKLAIKQPRQLLELKAVIEQVTLKGLISKIETMLVKNLPESKWQTFFKDNPFILGLAFPQPIILIQDQAHVGGTTFSGSGESIVDFLFAQRCTGNLALIEIKRPETKLIESKTFRGDLHAPHKDLTSAMAQVLDQRFQLLGNFLTRAHELSLKDTHVSSVHCIVIAGVAPVNIQEKRSLDLFRNSSRDVFVVTFDELLEKLREILRLMAVGS